MLVQEGGGEKFCTSAHGIVVRAAAPELVLKSSSGLIKDMTMLSDPGKLDVVISSGSSKGLDRSMTWNKDIMRRAGSCGSRPCEHMHQRLVNPMMSTAVG